MAKMIAEQQETRSDEGGRLAQLRQQDPDDAAVRLAEAAGFHFIELARWESSLRRMAERYFWVARTGKAPHLLGLVLNPQTHPGFESKATAARHALVTLAAELQEVSTTG